MRPLIAISGATLAVTSMAVWIEPPILAATIPGIAVCGLAFAATAAGWLRAGVEVLRVVAVQIAIAGCVIAFKVPAFGILELLLGLLFLIAIGVFEITERRAAAAATWFGVVSAVWFAVLAQLTPARTAASVAFVASICLAIGGLRWLGDTARGIPTAIARQR